MSLVPGDPASLSSCAATAGTLSRRLAARSEEVAAALADLAHGWPGRRSVDTRRRGADAASAGSALAAELEAVATLLQDQATDLADLVARARAVEERAAAAGLEIRDDRVVPAPGIRGAADPDAEQHRDAVAGGLQAEVDLLLAQHRRRRDFVLGALRSSTDRLAQVSAGLRR